MSSNLSGLTCFALLRAIEHDLRSLVARHCGDEDANKLFDEALLTKAKERHVGDRRGGDGNSVASLLPYVDFGDTPALLNRLGNRLPEELRGDLKPLTAALAKVTPVRNRIAHARPLEIDDLPSVVELAERLARVPGFEWPELNRTQRQLADNPAFVLGLTPDLRKDVSSRVSHNLPAADFDETGLLGRRHIRHELRDQLLKGQWPVVSVLGEGGIGKTALALQVAYDLVDDPACPFEAVVWISAKTEVLSTSEIQRIPGAIQNSMGVFERAATQLAGPSAADDPISELENYLRTFPILLIMDNLETVLDERIHAFLAKVPPGCKVLITSRIGVRTQYGINLEPLSEGDATHLLRALVRIRHVTALSGLSRETAAAYAQRMNRHPGFIKWFVTGVQVGNESPERLLRRDGLVLDFCMRNVYDQLGEDSKTILQSLLIMPGSHTQAELSFLNDFEAARTQGAVYELLRTNFVSQMPAGLNRTALALSDFARKYLRDHHPPRPEQHRRITTRQQRLNKIGGDLQSAHSRDPYAPDTLEIRDAGDISAAMHLRTALADASAGRYNEALDRCRQAIELAPGYHEPHRVTAYVYDLSGNVTEADIAYQDGVELSDNNPYVRYFYGRFLIDNRINPHKGAQLLEQAHRLDPSSSVVELAIAQARLDLGAFAEAGIAAADLVNRADLRVDVRYDALYLLLRAAAEMTRQAAELGHAREAIEMIGRAVAVVEEIDSGYLTPLILDMCMLLEQWSATTPLAARLRERRGPVDPYHLGRLIGRVKVQLLERGYAFVTANGRDYFLHERDMEDPQQFYEISLDSTVAFLPGQRNGNGASLPAKEARWLL